jgi:hypothetical protein
VLVVGVRHETCANTTGDTCAKNSNATAAKATYVASANAAHVASVNAAHVASAEAAAHMAAAAATTASGLCTRCKQAPSKHCACQYHYHSSSHHILHWLGGFFATGPSQTLACLSRVNTNIAIDWRWECLSVVSTQFLLSHTN